MYRIFDPVIICRSQERFKTFIHSNDSNKFVNQVVYGCCVPCTIFIKVTALAVGQSHVVIGQLIVNMTYLKMFYFCIQYLFHFGSLFKTVLVVASITGPAKRSSPGWLFHMECITYSKSAIGCYIVILSEINITMSWHGYALRIIGPFTVISSVMGRFPTQGDQ